MFSKQHDNVLGNPWLALMTLVLAVSPSGVDLTIMGMYDVMLQILGTNINRIMIVMPDLAYQAHTKVPPMFPNMTCQGEVYVLLFCIDVLIKYRKKLKIIFS